MTPSTLNSAGPGGAPSALPDDEFDQASVWWPVVLGSSMFVFWGAVFTAALLALAIGMDLTWGVLIPAAGVQLGFLVAVICRRTSLRSAALAATGTVLLTMLSLTVLSVLATAVSDTSIDGRHYHAASIHALADGWNPLRDPELRSSRVNNFVRTNAYPKAPWILEAAVFDATGDFESTKIVTWSMTIAAALVAFGCFRSAGLRGIAAAICSAAASLSPVVATQLFTHMVDAMMGALVLAGLTLVLLWLWHPGRRAITLPPLLIVVVLMLNTKQSGFVFAGVILGGLVVIECVRARRSMVPILGGILAALLAGTLLFGFNPYVLNTVRHGNPLHIVAGKDAQVETSYAVGDYADTNPPVSLLRSLSSRSGGSDAKLKLPFSFTVNEWKVFNSPGTMSGGFGPLFSGVLLLAVLAACLIMLHRRHALSPKARALLIAAALCVVATLLVPTSFVARFAPQLWLVPILVFAAALGTGVSRYARVVGWVGLALVTANAVGVASVAVLEQHRNSETAADNFTFLGGFPGPFRAEFTGWSDVSQHRLDDEGLRYVVEDSVECALPVILTTRGTLFIESPQHRARYGDVILCPPE